MRHISLAKPCLRAGRGPSEGEAHFPFTHPFVEGSVPVRLRNLWWDHCGGFLFVVPHFPKITNRGEAGSLILPRNRLWAPVVPLEARGLVRDVCPDSLWAFPWRGTYFGSVASRPSAGEKKWPLGLDLWGFGEEIGNTLFSRGSFEQAIGRSGKDLTGWTSTRSPKVE